MLPDPWAVAAVAVIAAELGGYVMAQRRRRQRERDRFISRRELERINGHRP